MVQTKYIVICGGVMSGVGKGVSTASIAKILQEYGFSVTAIKIDPYINLNAGTLRPTEHGEVWVTDDGGEIDQDLGNYERFLGIEIPKKNNITTGQIYKSLIDKEIRGDFLGETVQFVPHVPDEIKKRVKEASQGYDFALVEIGGTVGDYDNIPFLFAMKSLEVEIGKENLVCILITYLPIPDHMGEMKTKPTQTAIRLLMQHGIFPDFILCRAKRPLDEIRRKKIEIYANIGSDYVISAPDVKSSKDTWKKSIYSIPLDFEKENLGEKILKKFNIQKRKEPNWQDWISMVKKIENTDKSVNIAIVGKYVDTGSFSLPDSYISVNEALNHASASLGVGVKVSWIDAKKLENYSETSLLKKFSGIIVPGGFGSSGVEGKINAIRFARENKIPYLGLCYGMQLAVIEFARNVCGIENAHTTEIDQDCPSNVIDLLPEQKSLNDKSGTMRLGAYTAVLSEKTRIYDLYKKTGRIEKDKNRIQVLKENGEVFRLGKINDSDQLVLERHRHRFEQNPRFIKQLEDKGLIFSGYHERLDGTKLMEFIELKDRDNFFATQAHPEYKSRLGDPAPLFYGFLESCLKTLP